MLDFAEHNNLSKFEKTFLNEFFNDLEKREDSVWSKPWQYAKYQNVFSGHEYSGMNEILLGMISRANELSDPRFATFNQAKENGYHIEKGSKGIPLQFFTFINKETKKPWNEEEFREKTKNMTVEQKQEEADKKVPLAKTFHVFHSQNIINNENNLTLSENIPMKQFTKKINTNELIDEFENNLINNMEVGFIEIHSEGAFYTPKLDQVTMPLKEQFNTYEERMSVLLHELGHATGHEKRLNRELDTTFGSSNYSKEEMIVEINSVFMTNLLGLQISEEQKENHLLYMDSWGKTIKNNPKEFIYAMRDSLKIKDYMIENGKFNDIFIEQEQTIDFSKEEIKAFTISYNDFLNNEYEHDTTIEELQETIVKDDFKLGLAYTEDEDDLGLVEFNKQATYDLENEKIIFYRDSEYLTIEREEACSIEEMTEVLKDGSFDSFISDYTFKIDREDLAHAIQLTAYTEDDTYLKDFAKESNADLTRLETDYIISSKNYLLSNVDDETIAFFEEKGVTLSNDFIHDREYKYLSEFQLSHYESITEQKFPPHEKIIYNSDIENDENIKNYSNYKDLWETEFKNSFIDDFNNFTIEEIEQNQILEKANPNLLNRLVKNYDDVGKEIRRARTLSKNNNSTRERDLDADGVPDRIDIDDTRNAVQTTSDLNLVDNRTDKTYKEEEKKIKQRTR